MKEEKEQTTLRLKNDLYKELKSIAKQSGLSITSLLIIAMWNNVLKS